MVSLIEFCSEGLIAALAGTSDPRFARSLAHRRIVECVGGLPGRYARVLTWQFALDGVVRDAATVAEQMHLSRMRCEQMLEEALIALGWELIAEISPPQLGEVAA